MSKDYLIMIPAGIIVLLMIFMPIHYSKTYDKVTGVITGDRIRVRKTSKRNREIYYIDFEYEYSGVKYSATRHIPKPSKEDTKAVGSELDVYVNPEKPEKIALLYNDNTTYTVLIIMIVYNIGVIYRFIKDYKEINRYSGQYKNTFSK